MARYLDLHPWQLAPTEAVELQRSLQERVDKTPPKEPIRTIAGTDISFDKGSEVVYAGVIVHSLPDLDVVERSTVVTKAPFPYIPGLLSFREIPPLLEAWAKLEIEPDSVMVDGHGYAHPRRMGIACHLGLLLDRPVFGCAKSVLVGKYEEPGSQKGSWSPLVHRNETVGVALRTRADVSPVYVSVGHKIDLDTAIELTMRCTTGIRIPEPTRQAHLMVNEVRRQAAKDSGVS